MRITKKIAREMLEVLDEIRKEISRSEKEKYPFTEWERQRDRVRERMEKLPEYVEKAASMIKRASTAGRPEKLNPAQKTMLFLFTRLMNKSNRDMELVVELLKPLLKEKVSYKYIERLYSDEEVMMVLHNLFVLLLEEENISGNLSGDGTGYSLMITKHYRSDPKKKGRDYRYVFRMIDLNTGMYVAWGYSDVSEMCAYNKAMDMLKEVGISMKSITLDRYYSSGKILKVFGKDTKVFVIPKKNISKIGFKWSIIIKRIIEDPFMFMKNYFKRNLSECGFSSDKRRFGWVIRQKRYDRRETALFAIGLLHNIFFVRVKTS